MNKAVQAKHISDQIIMDAIWASQVARGKRAHERNPELYAVGDVGWGTLGDVQEALAEFPPKVVLAKIRSLIRRGKMSGCGCGCRGDFDLQGLS